MAPDDRAPAETASDRRLPAGRHALPRELVARSQRDRLLDAIAAACAERGYSETSVADIVGRAQVSRKAFYDLFGDKESCFLAAYDRFLARFVQDTVSACNIEGITWPEQMRIGLGAGLESLAAQPGCARMATIDVFAVGPVAVSRYHAMVQILSTYVDAGRSELPDGVCLSGRIAPGLVEGMMLAVRNEILGGREEELPRLLPALLYTTLVPFLGPDRALLHHREAAAGRAGGQLRLAG
jgi:AcrR family transcriptional regulator